MLNEEMSAGTNAEQSTNDEVNSVSPDIGNTHVVCSQSPEINDAEKIFSGEPILSKDVDVVSNKISYARSERGRKLMEDFLANPEKYPARVTMVINPKNTKEYVLVLPDAYHPEFEFKDYLKTHKVLKQQTPSCD